MWRAGPVGPPSPLENTRKQEIALLYMGYRIAPGSNHLRARNSLSFYAGAYAGFLAYATNTLPSESEEAKRWSK